MGGSLYRNGPARRLLCSACRQTRWPGLTLTGRAVSFSLGREALGLRQYATVRLNPNARTANPPPPPPRRSTTPPSSPAPSRAPRLSAKSSGPPGRQPARLIFSTKDVPLLQEWLNSLESLGNQDLTPLQCVDGAQRYVAVATQYESQWRPSLEKEHKLSPYMLHWLGILLVSGNTAPRWRLGTHMLRSASELGYMPSTLSLVRIFTSMPSHMFDKAASTVMYREANARFQEAVKEGTDPNALTLQGIIHAKSMHGMKAMAMFGRAKQAAMRQNPSVGEEGEPGAAGQGPQVAAATSQRVTLNEAVDAAAASREFTLPPPREPRWEWEVSCVLGQANLLARDMSTTAEAVKLFRVAALELDNPHGFFMLAKLMGGPRDSAERRTYLLKAAVSGDTEACRELGQLEKLAAASSDLSQKERDEHEMLSKEWSRLADGEDLSAFIQAEDVGSDDVEK